MDSDLPLIDIAGEDDSLLHSSPHGAVSTSTTANDDTDLFLCSPLHPPPRSPPKEVAKVNGDRERESSMNNKENTNLNKIEEKKFSLQPQQMKRKKKGGFNLRKSLAWDRAFFEEEGVLNSEELAMITGSGSLSVIHEEASDSAYLQDLEENLFKVNPGSTPKKDRTTGGSPLSKHTSPARDNAVPGSAGRRKVLSARDSNRSGSKRSGCPRPMASSSLKRPANVNTIKSATKEPKVSKLPVPKPVPCALPRTSKNMMVGASDLKRSQIAHPVNLNNSKAGINNEKIGSTGKPLTAKTFTRPTRRNVASYVKSSPTKAKCPPVTEANNGLEVITSQTSYSRDDRSRKVAVEEVTSRQALTSASHASYCRDDRLRKVPVPLTHSSPNLPHTQFQTSKPSGLRLPSPSLSFFHQPKATSLPVLGRSTTQSSKIPNVRQIGSANPVKPPSVRKMANTANAGTGIDDDNVQCSGSGPSAIPYAKMDKLDSVLQIRLVQAELPSNLKGSGITVDHRKLNSIPVHGYQQSTPQAEPNISEELSYMEDVNYQSHDRYLMDQGSSLAFPPKSSEIQGDSLEKVADARAEVQSDSVAENKIFNASSFSRCEEQAKVDCGTLKTMSRDLHVDDAQILASDKKMDEVNYVKLNASAPDSWQLVKIDHGREKPEQQHLSNPCYIGEQVCQDDRSDLNECVLDDFDALPGKTQHNNVLPGVELKEPEENCTGTDESAVPRYVITPVMADCSSNEVEMVDSPNVENIASISVDDRLVIENRNIDTQLRNDIRLHGQDCIELCNMDEDERRDSLTTHDIKTTTLISGGSTSQLSLIMQIEAGSAKDTIEHRHFGFKGFDLSVESSSDAPHSPKPEDDIISCHPDTSMVQTEFIVDKINVSEEETNVPSGEFDDGKHRVEQAKQVVSCPSADARILNWNIEDYGLLFEGRKSMEECHKYNTANIEDISSKVNLCDTSGLQSTPDPSKGEKMEEAHVEVDEGIVMIKEPLPGPPENRSSVANCRHSVDFNNVHSNNTPCDEYGETDELVLDQYDACGSEPMCSNACTEAQPTTPDGRPDLEGEVGYSQLDIAVTRSSLVERLPENIHSYKISRDTDRLYDQAASVESDSSSKTTNEEDSVCTLACNSLEGKSRTSLISDQTSPSGSILPDNEVTLLSSNGSVEDVDTNVSNNNYTLDDELRQDLYDTLHLPEDTDAEKELKKSRSGRKEHSFVIIPPPHAVPFSDEWLAAIEAAGEEILTKKGGAVQNSPPNKSPPRLGPYSPVKRKQNQVIGPFDCTKKHNNNPLGFQ